MRLSFRYSLQERRAVLTFLGIRFRGKEIIINRLASKMASFLGTEISVVTVHGLSVHQSLAMACTARKQAALK